MSRDLNYIFSDQGIEELKERLGIQEEREFVDDIGGEGEGFDIVQVEGFLVDETIQTDVAPTVEAGGVSFPFPITVSTPTSRIAPDGSTVFDVVISFDDVIGATDYEVRYVV